MTRNHLKNGHKKTKGTDFNQFCAACELIFSRPIKCCSRILHKKMLPWKIKKIKCCSGTQNLLNFGFSTKFSSKCCGQISSATQLAVESRFRKKQVYELFFLFLFCFKSAQAASAQCKPQGAKPDHTSCPDQAAPGCPDH